MAKKITVNEFAKLNTGRLEELTGIRRMRWWEWFNAAKTPKLSTARKAANALGLSLDEFDKALCDRIEATAAAKGK